MSPLRRKLGRDLLELRGQILTISIVVACGVSAFVALGGTHRALVGARAAYYATHRMGDIWANAERAPSAVASRLQSIPGVSRLETRIQAPARIPLDSLAVPADARVISIPDHGRARLGELRMIAGRRPRSGHHEEVVLLDTFAAAHEMRIGAELPLVLEGQERRLRVVGIAASPEWVIAMAPGSFAPNESRFAVVWMRRDALAAATGLEGAFNEVVLELQAGASDPDVRATVDRELEGYGGVASYGIDRHPSHYFLAQELTQLEGMSSFVPYLFLAVAAFLLNVVIARVINLQRGIIATLKAVGYSDRSIALHYLELVLAIVSVGASAGLVLGVLMGRQLTSLYMTFYHLPELGFRLRPELAAASVLVSAAAGVIGGLGATRSILSLTPAEAMRPPAPPVYRRAGAMSAWARALFPPTIRMVFRELYRRPIRAGLSVVGIALSVGLVVLGASMSDAMHSLLNDYLPSVQREQVTVSLRSPLDAGHLSSFRGIDGVLEAQGLRALSVRFESRSRSRAGVLNAYSENHSLRPLRDLSGVEREVPESGILLTDVLADRLGLHPGDTVQVVVTEGARRSLELEVAGTISEAMGLAGHISSAALHRALREPPQFNQVLLRIDPLAGERVRERVNELPAVAAVGSVKEALSDFADQSGQTMTVFSLIIFLFAGAITIGVVYNNARITLNARRRDLASMRILGFTKNEIGNVLLLEMATQVALALPLGMYFGREMLRGMMADVDPEAFRMPLRIFPGAYATAALLTFAAALAAAWLVRRRLGGLDLIAVLKTRE